MYAQTNIQLFNQLQREGYSKVELGLIRDAYELARQLYSGFFILSGRTQIAHVVGTASILGSLHAPAEAVAAGLIHNVYENGDFGDGRGGFSDARRQQICQVVGIEVEEYVYRFPSAKRAVKSSCRRPHPQTLSAICGKADTLDPMDRQVLLLVLADRLDHRRNLEYMKQNDHFRGEIAEQLGFPGLAAELKQVFDEKVSAKFSGEFASKGLRRSGVIAPRSYRKRLWPALRPKLSRSFYRVRSTLGMRRKVSLLVQRVYQWRSAIGMNTKT